MTDESRQANKDNTGEGGEEGPKASIDQAKADLRRLKDELKVQVHLAKKDAELAWRELEPAIGSIEEKLEDAGRAVEDRAEGARLQARLGLAEAKARWPGLERAIVQAVDDVKRGAADLKTGIDTARVRSHLAQMNARDQAGERLHAAEAELKKAGAELQAEIVHAAAELKGSFRELTRRIVG
jgi:hypothetical protein